MIQGKARFLTQDLKSKNYKRKKIDKLRHQNKKFLLIKRHQQENKEASHKLGQNNCETHLTKD